MITSTAACAWECAPPSRSRTHGAKRADGTRATEDAELRCAVRGSQVCGVVVVVISLLLSRGRARAGRLGRRLSRCRLLGRGLLCGGLLGGRLLRRLGLRGRLATEHLDVGDLEPRELRAVPRAAPVSLLGPVLEHAHLGAA